MNSLWWTCMIILLVVLLITCIVLCKAFLRDIKYVNRLVTPIYPEIAVVPQLIPLRNIIICLLKRNWLLAQMKIYMIDV